MELNHGFVTVPRLGAGLVQPVGAVSSVTVVQKISDGVWSVRWNGTLVTVHTDLPLVPGQHLQLRLKAHDAAKFVFQESAVEKKSMSALSTTTPLGMAFLTQGLPLVSENLHRWSRWVSQRPGPSDRDAWAASLEARGFHANDPVVDHIEPWLEWQAALERGVSQEPPEDDGVWDYWNLTTTRGGDAWLVMPLHWEHMGMKESGLLKAHWSPPAQTVDQWVLVASPDGIGFRLEARCGQTSLDLTWRFFSAAEAKRWELVSSDFARMTSSDSLAVTVRVVGPDTSSSPEPWSGVDVSI